MIVTELVVREMRRAVAVAAPVDTQLIQELQNRLAALVPEGAILLNLLYCIMRVHGCQHAVHVFLPHCSHQRRLQWLYRP